MTAYAEQMGGVAARIISIDGLPFPNASESFFTDLHNSMGKHYGIVGLEFVKQWLANKHRLIPEFQAFLDLCQKKSEGNAVVTRVARNYAVILFAGKLLNTFFDVRIDLNILFNLFDELVAENKALDKPKQLLETMLKDLDANRKAIYYEYEPQTTMKALFKQNMLWITPKYLKDFLGVEEKAVRAAWLQRGYTMKFENRGKVVDYKQVRAGREKFSGIGLNNDIVEELGFDFSVN